MLIGATIFSWAIPTCNALTPLFISVDFPHVVRGGGPQRVSPLQLYHRGPAGTGKISDDCLSNSFARGKNETPRTSYDSRKDSHTTHQKANPGLSN